MLIDVKYLADKTESFSFNEKLELSVGTPEVLTEGHVSRQDNSFYVVKGRIKAVLNLNCDLCLKPFDLSLDTELNEVYSEEVDEDGEIWPLTDKTIDLKPAVIANIMLNLPMQVLCSDDCKGLCSKCGHNLNDGDCGCDRGYVNPQFEKLLNLFNDD